MLPTGTLKLADKKSIYLPSTIKLVIETDEFLGVDIPSVHMTAKDISWESMVDRWLHTSGAKLVSSHEELLKLLFHKLVKQYYCFVCVSVCICMYICMHAYTYVYMCFVVWICTVRVCLV